MSTFFKACTLPPDEPYFGNYGKTYGSLAGVMLLSFWFWIAAVILLAALQIDRIIEDEQKEPP